MYLKIIIMKYFLIGIASASASVLTLLPSSNAIAHQNITLKQAELNKIINKKLSNLEQKRTCLEGSKNFEEYKNCQGIEFDKFVEEKIKRIDKLAKCLNKVSDNKELKKCKKVKRKIT